MIFHRLRLINKDQRGITLTELLVAICISAIIGVVINLTIFQLITGSARTNSHTTAVRQVQSAGFWVSRDVQMAQSITPPEGGLPLTLTWTEWDNGELNGNQHNVVYTLASSSLQREHLTMDNSGTVIDDDMAIVAEYIDPTGTTCEFTNGVFTFTVTATVQEQSETRTYKVVPRPSSE